MSSRWATSEVDVTASERRKREKEEKRRLKDERAQQAVAAAAASQYANSAVEQMGNPRGEHEGQPPSKRPRTSPPPAESGSDNYAADDSESNLPSFSRKAFGPSASANDYELLNAIEEGSYGKVSRAKNKISGEIVALKKLKLEAPADGFPITGLREIQTLRACSHGNIVSFREVVVGSALSDVYIVMEFLEHDLKTLLEDISEPFLPSEIKTLMLQITSGLSYLHSHFILHRDLKTSNLLLNNRGEVKLADFGMARYTGNPPPRLTQLVVTLWYRAPELLLGTQEYSFEIDIWSLGCIFAELLTRDPLFQGKNEVSQLSLIFDLLGTPTTASWTGFRNLPNAKTLYPLMSNSKSNTSKLNAAKFPYLTGRGLQLLSLLLSMNPAYRPDADEILQHKYFSEDPRPKAKEMFPTFPSKAGQENRRRKATPQAPIRGEAPMINSGQAASVFGASDTEEHGAGFALKWG